MQDDKAKETSAFRPNPFIADFYRRLLLYNQRLPHYHRRKARRWPPYQRQERRLALAGLAPPLLYIDVYKRQLLYMPCVATFAVIKKELLSTKKALAAMAFQTAVAWLAAFVFYRIALLVAYLW